MNFIMFVANLYTTLLAVALLQVHGQSENVLFTELYAGRHFNDMLLELAVSETRVIRGAVLIMYTDRCKENVSMVMQQEEVQPPPNYLTVFTHNTEETHKYIWFHLDEVDDLSYRYPRPRDTAGCAYALLFPPGSDVRLPTHINMEQLTIERMWDVLKTSISIINGVGEDIFIKFYGEGPPLDHIVLHEGDEVEVTVYRSYLLAAFRTRDIKFLDGFLLDDKFFDDNTYKANGASTLIISGASTHESHVTWLTQERQKEEDETNKFLNFVVYVTASYMATYKAPVLLPKFDRNLVGYKKIQIPAEAYEVLKNFYETEGSKLNQTEKARPEGHINLKQVQTTEVGIPPHIAAEISGMVTPLVEDFAGCLLDLTVMYPIREYHRGNTLRLHVDGVNDHVISVILQVAQDLGENGSPWFLQIIDYEGKKKNISLEPGEMFLFESSTIIHGRPYPLQGNTFSNSFLFYKPRDGWNWEYMTETIGITNGSFSENLLHLATGTMEQMRHRNWKADYMYHDLHLKTHFEL